MSLLSTLGFRPAPKAAQAACSACQQRAHHEAHSAAVQAAAERVELRLETCAANAERLRRLAATGLFGRDEAEAAERLICQQLDQMERGH